METSEFVNISNNDKKHGCKKTITSAIYVDGKKYFKKQLTPEYKDDLRYRMAFYKEFDTGLHADSKYIVRYARIMEDEQGLYILMEHINGMNMAEKIEAEPGYFRNSKHIEKLIIQLLAALGTLHKQNIAYLDLKPQNIMITQVSNDVKLTDLGGCFTDSNDYTAECTTGFAAPELLSADAIADARTDIYSLGKLLEYIEEKTQASLPRHIARFKERCLNHDRTLRYESTDVAAKALSRRGRIMWGFFVAMVLFCAAAWGWQEFEKTETCRRLKVHLASDGFIGSTYYKITSEKDATCSITGYRIIARDKNTGEFNTYIPQKVIIGGKSYTPTAIANKAFNDCNDLASIYLPNTIKSIGKYAFMSNSRLAAVNIPDKITTIETSAFYFSGIKALKLPKSLKVIGNAAFAECKRLQSVTIPEGTETLELDAFAGCDSLTSVNLPSSLKSIKRGVFWQCKSLDNIHIPASVEEIGEYSFYYCDSLKHFYNHATEPQSVISLFKHPDNVTVHVPAASAEKYRKASYWKDLNIVGDIE